MKKLFTMFAVCAATFTATAGTPAHASAKLASQTTASHVYQAAGSNLRSSTTCDTITNLKFNSADSNGSFFPWQAPSVGYAEGNGALSGGTSFFPITSVGEEFTANISGGHVVSATAFFAFAILNPTHSDSNLTVTAYVYDTTGTGIFGGVGPGNAIDSATTTTGFIANNGGALFTFTHQAAMPGSGFFIMIALPQVTGDTLVLLSNDGTTGRGRSWLGTIAGGGFVSIDSVTGGHLIMGNYIIADVCPAATSSCPTITVSATQSGADGIASATGGATPYTYSWSTTPAQNKDTATGLVNGTTYHVTATDANGCTGVGTLTIAGVNYIAAGVSSFSVFPNPSNGVFTASVSLTEASDVTVSIVDMTGNKIYETSDKAVKDLNKSINLSSIAAGVYFVSVKTDKGIANQRIIIK